MEFVKLNTKPDEARVGSIMHILPRMGPNATTKEAARLLVDSGANRHLQPPQTLLQTGDRPLASIPARNMWHMIQEQYVQAIRDRRQGSVTLAIGGVRGRTHL